MPLTNRDLLGWFSDGERSKCERCGERARVSVPDALASFCLACGAIWVNGVAIELPERKPQEGSEGEGPLVQMAAHCNRSGAKVARSLLAAPSY